LGVNPYISFAISAIVEIIAYVIAHLILDKVGRKAPYLFFLFMAGVSCFSITFIRKLVLFYLHHLSLNLTVHKSIRKTENISFMKFRE
jgi:hypothetical protein